MRGVPGSPALGNRLSELCAGRRVTARRAVLPTKKQDRAAQSVPGPAKVWRPCFPEATGLLGPGLAVGVAAVFGEALDHLLEALEALFEAFPALGVGAVARGGRGRGGDAEDVLPVLAHPLLVL